MQKPKTPTMKKIVLLIPAALLLFACGGNGNNTGENIEIPESPEAAEKSATDGTWVINKAEGMMADDNKGTEYIFDGENLTLSGGGIKNKGTWAMKGDTLVFTMKTFTGEMRYLKEMKGEQMVLKVVGSDQVFYLDKK